MEDFRTRGVKLVALVADPVDKNAEVAAHLGLEFPVLSDPDLAVIDRYGLRHSEGIPGADIARPAIFVLDRNGVVRWRDLTENYRVRPHPSDVLRVIDGL